MGAFEYQALDSAGRTQKGVLQGDTARAVRAALRERGLNALEVTPVAERTTSTQLALPGLRRGLSVTQLAVLTRQLATLIGAGLPMDEALAALAENSEDGRARAQLVSLRSRVMEGSSLAAGLAEFPDTFSDLYRASVAAGEQSGKLDQVLERLADYVESRDALRQKVMAALAYPVLLTVVAIAVVAALLVYVVPQVVDVFVGLKQQLPLATRALIAISAFVAAYGFWLVVALVLLLIGARILLARPAVRERWHAFLMRLPLIGRLLRAADTARFARTLSLLTASSVPVLEALRISALVVSLAPLREALRRAAIKVREGGGFARALADSGCFPPVALRLIASGEKSGKLEQMLERAAEQQQREVDKLLNALTAVLGPLLILAVGALVLFIVLAILLPIFDLNDLVR